MVVVGVGVVLVGGGVVVLAWSAIHTLSVTRERNISSADQATQKPSSSGTRTRAVATCWTQVISWHVCLQPHVRESDSCSIHIKRGGAHTAIGGVDCRPNSN